MNINDVENQINLRQAAVQHLKNLNVKFSLRKPSKLETKKSKNGVFKVPLQALPQHEITLSNGMTVKVPKIMHSLCSFILTKVETEGIFRKGGSLIRIKFIQKKLDGGAELGDSLHVIDVACVLKAFLRDLPEPVLPRSHHELFLKCALSASGSLGLQLACLLLPIEHVHALAYLAEFLQSVSAFSHSNRMTAQNLAVVLVPCIVPAEELSLNQSGLSARCRLLELIVEHAGLVGVVPPGLEAAKPQPKAKPSRRRSDSISRVFSGLKKIVAGNKVACDADRQPGSASKRKLAQESVQESAHGEAKRPKSELEEMEERMSLIEDQLEELQAQCTVETPPSLSPSTDQVARRLSRELRIRRSDVVAPRSPSARRIGSVRRRSAEVTLKRGQPNTLFTGLPSPKVVRKLSFQNPTQKHAVCELDRDTAWFDPESFLRNMSTPARSASSASGTAAQQRASVQRLRAQQRGLVLARARLFEDAAATNTTAASVNKENHQQLECRTPMPQIRKPLVTPRPVRIISTPRVQAKERLPLKAL